VNDVPSKEIHLAKCVNTVNGTGVEKATGGAASTENVLSAKMKVFAENKKQN